MERLGSVEVRYAPHADTAILAFLQQVGGGWRLVSSDRALASRARALGAEVVSAQEFWHKLTSQSPTDEDAGKAQADGGEDYRSGVTPLPEQALRVRRKRCKRL